MYEVSTFLPKKLKINEHTGSTLDIGFDLEADGTCFCGFIKYIEATKRPHIASW